MTDTPPVAQALPSNRDYGEPVPWADARKRMDELPWYWLTTIRPDGRPHVRPVLAVWFGEVMYFISNETSRKARNIASNSHCVMTAASVTLPALDVVIEGDASMVSSETKLQRIADHVKKMGWPITVRDGRLDAEGWAPTAGPPPYAVFEVTPDVAFGFPGIAGGDDSGGFPHGIMPPTRWRF